MTEDELAAEWEALTAADGKDGAQADITDEDKLAAEWAAALEPEGDDEGAEADTASSDVSTEADEATEIPVGGGRELSQDEIDSLLGFGDEGSGAKELVGVHALVNSSLGAHERLPMLEVVFDRLVRLMSTTLRNLTSNVVEVSLKSMRSVRFGDYLDSIPLPAMLTVFKAEEWDNSGILTIDSQLIYSVVNLLLGGDQRTPTMRIEGRPYTTIERNLITRMARVILADISAAFEPLSPVTFSFDRLETNPRFATIARPANAAFLVEMWIDMAGRGGKVEVLLPYETLDPIRDLLLKVFMGERYGRDAIWEKHLSTELRRADVSLDAVFDDVMMPLCDVLNFKVGTQIGLNATPESQITVRCDGEPMFGARMGRRGGHLAVQIEQRRKTGKTRA